MHLSTDERFVVVDGNDRFRDHRHILPEADCAETYFPFKGRGGPPPCGGVVFEVRLERSSEVVEIAGRVENVSKMELR